MMIRRSFLRKLAAIPLATVAAVTPVTAGSTKLKILIKSAWGSDDPTKAAFPFLHAEALSEGGHDVQIFLLGEAVSLMRKSVANAVVPWAGRRFRRHSRKLLLGRYQSTLVARARARGA